MKRIDTSTRAVDLFGPGKDGFKDGDLANGIAPTDFNAAWPNGVQEEIISVISAAGIAPSGGDLTQLLQAIRKIATGRMLNIQRFVASGTYTPTAGATKALVYVVGAGGGGGGGFATSASSYSVGSGGGSGALALIQLALAGGSAPVVVGAGGGSAVGGAGFAGGASSFGGTSAPGGGGGGTATTSTTGNSVSGQGAPGGTPTIAGGHTLVLANGGAPGACGFIFASFGPTSGQGGNSSIGGGGGTNTSGGLGGPGNAPGAGGGGSANNLSVGNTNGGTGANGLVLVYEFS